MRVIANQHQRSMEKVVESLETFYNDCNTKNSEALFFKQTLSVDQFVIDIH